MYEECLDNEVGHDSRQHILGDHMTPREDHVTGGNSPSSEHDLPHSDRLVSNEIPFQQTKQNVMASSGRRDEEEGEVHDSSDETASGPAEDNQVNFDLCQFINLFVCNYGLVVALWTVFSPLGSP